MPKRKTGPAPRLPRGAAAAVASRPGAGAGAEAAKRELSPDRTTVVVETTPTKRFRKAARPALRSEESIATTAEPESLQSQQSGLVTDDGELSQPDSDDLDLNLDMDFQEGEHHPPTKPPKVYKERGPRGKYKPREGKMWAGQFLNRRPDAVGERPRARSARNESVEVETPGDQDRSQRSASETPSLSSPKGRDQEWYPDPPMMEYPYLQHPFPFHEYEPPPNRVDTGDFGGTPQPMPDDWYRPQGSVAGEDLFTQEKLNYSLSMAKKIEVDTEHLRMDVYFQRGFELATRRMLDRIRAKNRLEDIRDEAQSAGGGGERNHRSEPIKDPARIYTRAHPTAGLQQSERQAHVPGDQEDRDSTSTPTPNPSSINELSVITDASMSTTPATDGAETEDLPSETDDRKRRMSTDTTPTLTDYYQVNAFMTSLFIPGESQSTLETPLSPAACRILQTLLLNLETKMLGWAAISSDRNSRGGWHSSTHFRQQRALPAVAQHRGGGIRDSRQRRLKAQTHKCDMDDYVLHIQPGRAKRGRRKRQPGDSTPSLDAEPSTSAGTEVGTEAGTEAGTGAGAETGAETGATSTEDPLLRRPFVSNPLEIPAAMEPFWKARDYMERQALEARIRAAAEEAQRRQPRAPSNA
ncbi:unnamed protein product [Mortierella alpina]